MKIYLINKITGARLDFNDGNGFVLSGYDLGKIETSRSTTQYINLIGQHVDSSVLGVRDMSFSCAIVADSAQAFESAKNFINNFINPLQEIELHYGKYVIEALPDSTIEYANDNQSKSATFQKFGVTMTAYFPMFSYDEKTRYADSSKIAVPLFPMIIPKDKGISFGYIPAITVKNPINEGDVATGFILRFTALQDNITNPKITNNKTGAFIETIVNMQKNDVVEISTVSGNKYAKLIRGTSETDLINNVTNASTFDLTLNVGLNDIGITNSSGNVDDMKISLEYVPVFMGVA